MRNAFIALALAAATATAIPAMAQATEVYGSESSTLPYAAPVGIAVGTVIGVGTYNSWWGSGTLAAALPTSVAGAATVGGVAGIGAVATVDALLQPCRGFHALFALNDGACVNGDYVGYAPPPTRYRRHG